MATAWLGRSGEIEVLLRVAEAGSLSAAARSLGLTPSGVSRVVARLEARLGARLILRTTRRLALTPEGEAYCEAGRKILADLDEAEREIADGGDLRGRLRVNASLPFGSRKIVPLLPEFLALHPHVRIDLHLSDQVSDLVTQRTDVAIRVGVLADSALTAVKLFDNRRLVVAAPSYVAQFGAPTTPGDLPQFRLLDFDFPRLAGGWPFVVDGERRLVDVDGDLRANNGETLLQLAVAGLGVARLGAFLVEDDIAAGRLIVLLEDFDVAEAEPINALFIGGANTPRRVRAFVEFLKERVRTL